MFLFVQFNLNFKVKIISIVQILISKSLWITASLFMAKKNNKESVPVAESTYKSQNTVWPCNDILYVEATFMLSSSVSSTGGALHASLYCN